MLKNLRFILKKEICIMFTDIIIPVIEAKSVVTFHQRVAMVKNLERIFDCPGGGQLLVEIYINYDCDPTSPPEENVWERLLSCLSSVMTANLDNPHEKAVFSASERITGAAPAITTSSLASFTKEQVRELYSATGDLTILKNHVLRLLVRGILQPLVFWCNERVQINLNDATESRAPEEAEDAEDSSNFNNQKLKKQNLTEGIKRFNLKYKKGIKFLLDCGCIESNGPQDIAKFLLESEGLDKHVIGEYLGEGEEHSIKIMHAFVDLMDFSHLSFVDALRSYLNHFRLPGEAQKIDRFMLKFAQRFVHCNPTSFTTADTAYVLAYSVIMLNTDQHNPQVKKRMTIFDFIKNNRGIDEGKDVDGQFLEQIFEEIVKNEIKLKGEEAALHPRKAEISAHVVKPKTAMKNNAGAINSLANLDEKFEKFGHSVFYIAHHVDHVKPMFQLIWMSCLMSISSFLQKTDDADTVAMALAGFKAAIRLSCVFDLDLERKAFISNLSKFTKLTSAADLTLKQGECVKMMLEISHSDGNSLQDDWLTSIKVISQLDKIQQIGAFIPSPADPKRKVILDDAFDNISSQQITLAVDRIFSQSGNLSASAIVSFVTALCETSWDEILSSDGENPRMYCLQRLVEIGYYNMKRIRLEWSQIWQILGPHVTRVACHLNSNIAYFALDKLRQLSIKFLDIDELANFKFQKDFLRPFEVALENSNLHIKDMVLTCLQQMIQTKSEKLKSGWKAIFATIQRAANEPNGIASSYRIYR